LLSLQFSFMSLSSQDWKPFEKVASSPISFLLVSSV
jgi:hypothetical protein